MIKVRLLRHTTVKSSSNAVDVAEFIICILAMLYPAIGNRGNNAGMSRITCLQDFPEEAHMLIQESKARAEAMHATQHQRMVGVVFGFLS